MAVLYSKASGFHGAKCWKCYTDNQREYIREWRKPKAMQLNQMELTK